MVEIDPDAHLFGGKWFENAVLMGVSAERSVPQSASMRTFSSFLSWWQGYQSRINKVIECTCRFRSTNVEAPVGPAWGRLSERLPCREF
ncbi:hypothetical protein SRM_00212 [Salinibacter ruber M8]|uniref:Uncharacterized protein n=1 Tax=Salinibacter ruber (strain M8) TaxID=761659 RepID=D5H528_SALRM|nr:hypothetical protein SRM_00212 [Salinibacter ruber M8]